MPLSRRHATVQPRLLGRLDPRPVIDTMATTTTSRPPLSPCSSDTSLGGFGEELDVFDLGLETDAVLVNGINRRSSLGLPGSPTDAARLDVAVAMSATDREVAEREVAELHCLSSAGPGVCPFDCDGACPVFHDMFTVAVTESNETARGVPAEIPGESAATSAAAKPVAVEMDDAAVHEAAATLAETSMSEGYSDISDVEEDPVEPVRLDVLLLPEGTDSGGVVTGTIGQTHSTTPVLGELAQPMPL